MNASEMKNRLRGFPRAAHVWILEELCSCACYDSENEGILIDAIVANVKDGTISDLDEALESYQAARDAAMDKLTESDQKALGL